MCLICQRTQAIEEGTNPYFVKELETGYVVIGDHQYFTGYTLFLSKTHATELHHLPQDIKKTFLWEMALVQEAVAYAFDADKMNVELLGNGDAHLHWHIFPRKEGDLENYGINGRGPVWWLPHDIMFDDKQVVQEPQLSELKYKLSASLDSLLP